MDGVAEGVQYQTEIDDVLTSQGVSVDDDKLNAELDRMEADMAQRTDDSPVVATADLPVAPNGAPITVLPTVPTNSVIVPSQTMEEEQTRAMVSTTAS